MRSIFLVILFFISTTLLGQDDQNPCLNNQDFHIVILGSSTAAGTGPSSSDSTWVNRYRKFLQDINPNNLVTNLAIGGTTTYHIMPDWFAPPSNRPTSNSNNNVSQAISLGADAIIVNMPSNDASNNFGIDAQMFNFQTISTVADSVNIPVWICTTQPKTPFGVTQDAIQLGVRDSIFSIFGNKAIDFWNGIALPSNDIDPMFDSGDGTHLNDAAHAILFERVQDKNVLSEIFEPTLGTELMMGNYTVLNPMLCGDSETIVQGEIINIGEDNFSDIHIQHDFYISTSMFPTTFYDTIFGGLNACESISFDFSVNTFDTASYSILSAIISPNDSITWNNISPVINFTTQVPPILTPQNDTICKNEMAFLSVDFENTDTIFWFENLTDLVPIGSGNNLTTSPMDISQTYFAEGISGDLFFKESLFTTNNSNKNWNGVMINLVAHETLTLDSFSLKLEDIGSQGVVAYFKNGSYEGFENDASAWTFWGVDFVEVLTSGNFHHVNFGNKILEQGDTLGIYFHLQNGGARLSYNDATDWVSRSTDELEIRSGSGITHTFGIIYFPRDWNGEVFYHHGFNPEGDCSSGRVEVSAIVSEPIIDLGNDTIIISNQNISLDGGANFTQYFWNGIEGGQFYNIDSTSFGIGTHEVILEAINEFGCTVLDTIEITITEFVGISNEYFIKNNFEVFPNPTQDFFWVKNLNSSAVKIQLFDLFGKMVFEKTIVDNLQISVSHLPKGVYFLHLKNKHGWGVERIIIE
ncbi:MAG: T9SS type A sorting domain-containing protein [Saprospiraceae bacterium]